MTERDETLGQEIRRRRNEKELTQKALAGSIGSSSRQIIRWERDQELPSEPFAQALERELGVSAATISALRERQHERGLDVLTRDLLNQLAAVVGPATDVRSQRLVELIMAFVATLAEETSLRVVRRVIAEGVLDEEAVTALGGHLGKGAPAASEPPEESVDELLEQKDRLLQEAEDLQARVNEIAAEREHPASRRGRRRAASS